MLAITMSFDELAFPSDASAVRLEVGSFSCKGGRQPPVDPMFGLAIDAGSLCHSSVHGMDFVYSVSLNL